MKNLSRKGIRQKEYWVPVGYTGATLNIMPRTGPEEPPRYPLLDTDNQNWDHQHHLTQTLDDVTAAPETDTVTIAATTLIRTEGHCDFTMLAVSPKPGDK